MKTRVSEVVGVFEFVSLLLLCCCPLAVGQQRSRAEENEESRKLMDGDVFMVVEEDDSLSPAEQIESTLPSKRTELREQSASLQSNSARNSTNSYVTDAEKKSHVRSHKRRSKAPLSP
jgi:hypothetical protein